MPNPKVDLKNRHLALILAWMVPGLGHFYQGRTGKGVLYAVSILSLFLVGLAMGGVVPGETLLGRSLHATGASVRTKR